MAVIGILELYTPSGWLEIEVRDPADLPSGYDFIEVYTPSGWGAIPVVENPLDATTPLEVYTPSGWRGISQQAMAVIEDFEAGVGFNHGGWGGDSHGGVNDKARYSATNTLVHNGTWAAVADTPSTSLYTFSRPGNRNYGQTTDLPKYFGYGEHLRLFYYSDSTTEQQTVAIRVGAKSVNTDHWLQVYHRQSDALINYKTDNGKGRTMAQTGNINWGTHEPGWIQVDLWWDDGTLGGRTNEIRAKATALKSGTTVYNLAYVLSADTTRNLRKYKGIELVALNQTGTLAWDYLHVLPS